MLTNLTEQQKKYIGIGIVALVVVLIVIAIFGGEEPAPPLGTYTPAMGTPGATVEGIKEIKGPDVISPHTLTK